MRSPDSPRPDDSHAHGESELSLNAALTRLEAEGYEDQLRTREGSIAFDGEPTFHAANEFDLDETVRTEADSDADHTSLVLALRHRPSGRRGTLITAFGAYSDDLWGPDGVRTAEKRSPPLSSSEDRTSEGRGGGRG